MFLVILTFCLAFLFAYLLECRKPKNFPPGPDWYPIFGSALQIHSARKRTGMLCKAAKEVSQIYPNNGAIGLKVGKDKTVIVMNTNALKEMYLNEDIDGRPTGLFYETRTWGERYGIILTDGDFWTSQRRFIVRHLKDFGFARRGMTEIIQNEAEHLLEDFKHIVDTSNGKALVKMQNTFSVYTLNTLWAMMAGVRYSRNDIDMKELQLLLHKLFTNIDMIGSLFSHFPLLRFIAPKLSGYDEFLELHSKMYTFITKEVENHKKSLKDEIEPRDLMDVYLRAIKVTKEDNSFSEKQLLAICLDMFLAGSETTTKSLGFGMLHIIRNRDVQRKIQEEIDNVVGRNRLPTLDDKPNMPYCDAVVHEAVRSFMGNTFGIPHRALRDTKLVGYDIPKDTMVIANFAGTLMDPLLFPNPDKFIPERFLCNGKISIPDFYLPFALGKHRCMGDLMAKSNLFLFIVTLLQNFNFLIPDGHPMPSDLLLDGATPSVREYTALIVYR